MSDKIRLGTEKLEKEGHSIRRIFLGDNPRYLIDEEVPITGKEMRELADGISLAELKQRRAEETQE